MPSSTMPMARGDVRVFVVHLLRVAGVSASSRSCCRPKNEGEATRLPYYMLQAAYTPDAWAGVVKNPQNRLDAVRPVIEKLGGKIERGWLTFGEYDIVLVCQLPNNVSEEAFSMAASAGGAVTAVKTTPLMTIDEAMRGNAESQRGRLPARSGWRNNAVESPFSTT